MPITGSLTLQASIRARRFNEALNAFFPNEQNTSQNAKSNKTSITEEDFLEISPFNQAKQLINQARTNIKDKDIQISISIKVTNKNNNNTNTQLTEEDINAILGVISTGKEDFKNLKSNFNLLLNDKKESPNKNKISNKDSFDLKLDTKTVKINQTSKQTHIKNELTPEEQGIIRVDPLILDLNGDGLNLKSAKKGAQFDIDADGKTDTTAWVQNDDAILVYDKNGNGIIDDGSEMFGDQNGANNGFDELKKYDTNKDGKIDKSDKIYKALKLYQDINNNGKIDENELFDLKSKSIKSLNLQFEKNIKNINDSKLVLSGTFEREDGSKGKLNDVLLKIK